MFRSMLLALLAVVFVSSPAFAACYTAKEAEAEQAIRIHSELMVIGLNCQHLWPKSQRNLYAQYRDFTSAHQTLFKDYDNTMLGYFQRAGGGNAEGRLHDMHTQFANDISRKAASVRPDVFCMYYGPRIQKASKMSSSEVRAWAATAFEGQRPNQPLCTN